MKRLARIIEAKVPARLELGALDHARGAAWLQDGAVDPDVGAAGDRELAAAEGGLRCPWSWRVGIEQGQPQRRRGVAAGALVHGMADPDPLAAGGAGRLQVEALVVAVTGLEAGKPRLASHSAESIRTARRRRPAALARRSSVSNRDHVAVLDHVVAALGPDQAALPGRGVAAGLDQLPPADHLRPHEARLDLGVDPAGRVAGGEPTAK